MAGRSKIGALGEDIACKYLVERGYEVVERNYNKKQGEIDIVAAKGKSLHFIEVKSVSWNFAWGTIAERGIRPEENIHANKLKRLFRAVQIYLMERRVPKDTLWQMDALFVFIDQKRKKSAVEYYEHISLE
jgi:putative endonuclease